MKRLIHPWVNVLILGILVLILIPVTILADGGPGHRVDQPFPVQLGTSGGNINDISKGFCYGGTLGALVQDTAGMKYILSNNHVLARTNQASNGEDIIQPGLIDQVPTCAKDANDAVADLSAFIPILFKSKKTYPTNTVDAAIAQVRQGAVDPSGSILDIGVIDSATLAPSLDLAVKKSGRTSGLTSGTISAVNVTVDVSYGGGKTARFGNQIFVTPGSFIAGGDSGSLMVEDVATAPRAVGLLFAGSSSIAVANPIDPVLSAFGVSMVGSPYSASLLSRTIAFVKKLFRVTESHAASQQLPGHVSPAAVDAVKRVKERHESRLLGIPGVVGVGVGLSKRIAGQAVIEVYVKESPGALKRAIPSSLDGVEVDIVETGEIIAY
ncbi:MAG: hypothetical protein ACREQA_18205 [Candidatus Binatia bacterium]